MSPSEFEVPHVTGNDKKDDIYDAYRTLAEEYEVLREVHDQVLDELQALRDSGEFEPTEEQSMLMALGQMTQHYVKVDNNVRFHDDMVEADRLRGVVEEMVEELG